MLVADLAQEAITAARTAVPALEAITVVIAKGAEVEVSEDDEQNINKLNLTGYKDYQPKVENVQLLSLLPRVKTQSSSKRDSFKISHFQFRYVLLIQCNS